LHSSGYHFAAMGAGFYGVMYACFTERTAARLVVWSWERDFGFIEGYRELLTRSSVISVKPSLLLYRSVAFFLYHIDILHCAFYFSFPSSACTELPISYVNVTNLAILSKCQTTIRNTALSKTISVT